MISGFGFTPSAGLRADAYTARGFTAGRTAQSRGRSEDRRYVALGLALALALPVGFAFTSPAWAQERTQEKETTKTTEKEKPAEAEKPKEESSVTEHSIKIDGKTIAYKAIAGTILLKNEKDEPQALIYSTSYIRTDTKDPARPISFIYNGGPGSASVWLHMGAFGPRRVVTPNAEPTPPPPYKLTDNAGTLLDKTKM